MAESSVTLRNTTGGALHLWAHDGPNSFVVDEDGTVVIPGVVLSEGDDHYLIGPEGAEPTVAVDPDREELGVGANPAVVAWPKATWVLHQDEAPAAEAPRKGRGGAAPEGDGDAQR